jgi:hypothetical protein
MNRLDESLGELVGDFWVSEQPELVSAGRLTRSAETGLSLELDGALTLPLEKSRSLNPDGGFTIQVDPTDMGPEFESHLIHGRIRQGEQDDVLITLVDAFTVGRLFDLSSTGWGKQSFQAPYAVVGAHLSPPDLLFPGVRARLRNLAAWSASVPPNASANLPHGGVLSITKLDDPHGESWLSLVRATPRTYRELDRRVLMPLAALATLAAGVPCPVVALEVLSARDGAWLTLYSAGLPAEPVQEAPTRFLLPLEALGLDRMGTWLEQVDRLGPLPAAIADPHAKGGTTIEAQLLVLTTLAESLHRQLFPDARRMTEQEADKIRDAAVLAAGRAAPEDDKSHAESVVRGLLSHLADLGYRKRLRQLADLVSDAMPGVCGKTARWVELVADVRNDFAHHHGNNWLDDVTLDRYLAAAGSLQWLLSGVLLLDAGVSAEVLRYHFDRYQPYLFFQRNARQWAPNTYPST